MGDVTARSSAAITVFLAPTLPFSGQPSQQRGAPVPQKRERAEHLSQLQTRTLWSQTNMT